LTILSWVTAYHSFSGEVEASNTPTIRRLTPSRRHQLPRITQFARDAPNRLIVEAVSAAYSEQARQLLSPQKIDTLRDLGFSLEPSGNYFQHIDITSKRDIRRCARLALEVFQDVYEVKDFRSISIELPPDDQVTDEPIEIVSPRAPSNNGKKFSRAEQARILKLLQKDDLSPDEKSWLLNSLSRDDLSETQDFWLNGPLLGLSGLDEEQDPLARNAQGEAIRLHLISDLQGNDGKNGENALS